jgi:ribulose-5-phosphate 4-epimerase/fuculose-1-phosphate aldolase
MNAVKRLARLSSDIVALVNGQRRVDDKTRQALVPAAVRKSLLEAAHRAGDRDLVVALLSEISLRLPSGRIVANGDGTWLADLSEKDLAVVAAGGTRSMLGAAPCRHMAWHQWVYEGTGAAATLLCQPAAAIRLAQLGHSPRPDALPDAADLVGEVPIVEAEEGQIKSALANSGALLIRRYGLLVWGDSAMNAVGIAEIIAAWCEASLGVANAVTHLGSGWRKAD